MLHVPRLASSRDVPSPRVESMVKTYVVSVGTPETHCPLSGTAKQRQTYVYIFIILLSLARECRMCRLWEKGRILNIGRKKKIYIYICLKTSCWNIKSCEVGTQLSSCLSLNTCSMYVWPWEDAWPSTSWQEKCCHNAEVNNSPALQCSGFLHHKLGLLIWKT